MFLSEYRQSMQGWEAIKKKSKNNEKIAVKNCQIVFLLFLLLPVRFHNVVDVNPSY